MPADPSIHVLLELPDAVSASVRAMAVACEQADGSPPLSEETLLELRRPESRVLHLLAGTDPVRSDGYGFLRHAAHPPVGGVQEPAELEFMVAPERRGRRAGTALLGRALVEAGDSGLVVWAHGTLPAARRLAETNGLVPARRTAAPRPRDGRTDRSGGLSPAHPTARVHPAHLPPWRRGGGARRECRRVRRTSRTGGAVCGRAGGPDGRAWFDPAGLLLAVQTSGDGVDGRIVGFHWTKIEPSRSEDDQRIGEVYVLGTHPDAAGHGLGSFLLAAGLASLARRGVSRVHLYVEAENTVARRMYEKAGFAVEVVDTRYATAP